MPRSRSVTLQPVTRVAARTLGIILIAISGIQCSQSADELNAARQKFSATQPVGSGPIVGIWNEHSPFSFNPPQLPPQTLIVGVCSDGTIIWSNDRHAGGPPYLRGEISAEKVAALVDRVNAIGFFELTRQSYFGPDSGYTVIAAHARGTSQWIGSWHEGLSPGLVATQNGIQSASNPPPTLSPTYKRFLKLWADARAAIEQAIPETGVETTTIDPTIYKIGR